MSSSAILRTDFSAVLASTFLDAVISGNKNIYLAVGRDDSNPWIDEDIPDIPNDSLNHEAEARARIIGIKKINPNQVALIFKKIMWEPGKAFFPLDKTINGAKRAQDYYCVTSENRVFQCIDKIADQLTTVGSEPSLMGSNIATPDGYVWKFLFDINQSQLTQNLFVGEDWLPIGYNTDGVYGGTITSNQNSYGDNNANFELGSYRLLFNAILEDEDGAVPFSISYRQLIILSQPRAKNGEILKGVNYAADEFDILSGQMIFLENKSPTFRASDQAESLKIVVSF